MNTQTITIADEIVLKELEAVDAKVIFDTINAQREYLGEWLPFVAQTTDINVTQEYVNEYVNSNRNNLTFLILQNNKFAGLIGFKDSDFENNKTEIGYWLSEAYQHKGLVTLACKSLMKIAFEDLKMNRIQIKAATKNFKSCNVPERLGFRLEGVERSGEKHAVGYVDLCVYSLLKNEYAAQL